MEQQGIVMQGVREYAEEFDVKLAPNGPGGCLVIEATNEGGCNGTQVDLLDLLAWVRQHEELTCYGRPLKEQL